jgi:hypothetical protein
MYTQCLPVIGYLLLASTYIKELNYYWRKNLLLKCRRDCPLHVATGYELDGRRIWV